MMEDDKQTAVNVPPPSNGSYSTRGSVTSTVQTQLRGGSHLSVKAFTSSLAGLESVPDKDLGGYDIPAFDDVLIGEKTFYPWKPTTFLGFLQSERNEENLFFFEEVECFKAIATRKQDTPPENLLLLPKEVRKDPKIHAKTIVSTFVAEEAPHQVNISGDQRSRVLNRAQDLEQNIDAQLFEEAQQEIKNLMLHDSWPRFRAKMMEENITKEDGIVRRNKAIALFLLILLALGLMLGFLVPRLYFLLFIIPSFKTADWFTAYHVHFCLTNARNLERDKFGSAEEREKIACPIVKMKMKQRARFVFVRLLLTTILLAGFCFAMTYIVEAIVGRNLYG